QPQGAKTSESDMLQGPAAGATAGAALGGLAGLLVGLGALAIPGIGPIIAAGPLFATFFGAAAGSISCGFIGAVADWGIREDEAQAYVEGVRRGGSLVIVKAAGEAADQVAAIINRHNPVNMDERVATWRKEGWTGVVNKAAYTADGKSTVGTKDDQ